MSTLRSWRLSSTPSSAPAIHAVAGSRRNGPWLIVACVTMAACAPLRTPATAPVATTAQPVDRSPGMLAYEERLEAKVKAQDTRGDLAGEAVTLELLAILKPDDASVMARRRVVSERIGVAVREHLRRASEAYRRGLYDVASNRFLAALALSPDDQAAADGLRAIEKERNRRQLLVKQQRAAQLPEQGD